MPGTIPNSVFIHAKDPLVPHIGPLFRATNTLDFYPPEWARTETLILKKPGKPDYTTPWARSPIAFSDGLARLLNKCLAMDMVTMCERLQILPANHFRARPGRTTTDSIHLLTKSVKDAWRKKQVASALFLDVKSAFPSVDITRLVHNMRKRGIPKQYTDWLLRRFRLFRWPPVRTFQCPKWTGPRDPFSGILYLLYNSDLPKIADIKLGEQLLLFVDDAVILVTGKDFTATHAKLRDIMTRTNGIFVWAALHNCEFGIDKFQLLDFTKKMVPHPFNSKKKVPTPRKTFRLRNQRIPSKDNAKFLDLSWITSFHGKHKVLPPSQKGYSGLVEFCEKAFCISLVIGNKSWVWGSTSCGAMMVARALIGTQLVDVHEVTDFGGAMVGYSISATFLNVSIAKNSRE